MSRTTATFALAFALALIAGAAAPAFAASSGGVDLGGQVAHQRYEQGRAAEQDGNLQKAARLYQEAINADPKFAEAYNQLGYVQRQLGLYDDSIENYTEALRIKPKMAEAHEYIARAYMAQGKFDKAREHLKTLEAMKSEYAKDLATDLAKAEKEAKAKADAESADAAS